MASLGVEGFRVRLRSDIASPLSVTGTARDFGVTERHVEFPGDSIGICEGACRRRRTSSNRSPVVGTSAASSARATRTSSACVCAPERHAIEADAERRSAGDRRRSLSKGRAFACLISGLRAGCCPRASRTNPRFRHDRESERAAVRVPGACEVARAKCQVVNAGGLQCDGHVLVPCGVGTQ